jgi:N-carbamoylputrescine amidase
MKVTVCELSNDAEALDLDWQALANHVQDRHSEMVVLPEMPFYPWVASKREVDPAIWDEAVAYHDRWLARLPDLSAPMVVGTRPVVRLGRRLNEGFIWTSDSGYRRVHTKVYLPDEEGFWEASWYDAGPKDFTVVEVHGVRLGFLICTEMWFHAHARAYAAQEIDVLCVPRATPLSSVDKWIAGGRTAAVVSGAFCLSSNRRSSDNGIAWGGAGWIVEPGEGRLLGVTEMSHPFLTLNLDLSLSRAAKQTYPRYIKAGL